MEFKVLEKKDLRLMKRIYARVKVDFEGKTPSRDELKSELSKFLGTNSNLMIIKKIRKVFGLKQVVAEVHIYDNEEALKRFEQKSLLVKEGILKKEKGSKTPAEQKTEQK
jgi:small subunit ribosomal protein S24e